MNKESQVVAVTVRAYVWSRYEFQTTVFKYNLKLAQACAGPDAGPMIVS